MNLIVTTFSCPLWNSSSLSRIMKGRVPNVLVTPSIRNSGQCSGTLTSENHFKLNPTLHDQLELQLRKLRAAWEKGEKKKGPERRHTGNGALFPPHFILF